MKVRAYELTSKKLGAGKKKGKTRIPPRRLILGATRSRGESPPQKF